MTLTNKARAGYSSITIRGGRITKLNGQAASYAPHVAAAGLTASSSALALGLAIAGVMLTPGEAQAGTCSQLPAASGNWVCVLPAGADTTQTINGPAGAPITVTTTPGFGLTVAAGNGVQISGGGTNTGISFVDTNASTISASINGIRAFHYGSGALSITSTGTASGTSGYGIIARNSANGTDLTITANDSSGGQSGIGTYNAGSGALSVTSTGTATGTNGYGIIAFTSPSGTSLTITANNTTGGLDGINTFNAGSGALSITSTGTTTGTTYDGIHATNHGTSLTVTTGGATTGGDDGIDARNYGTSGLTITVNADVTGQNGMGIRAYNSANDTTASLVINQAAGTTTTGAIDGINANNFGGSLTINGLGTSVGTTGTGVFALNNTGTTTLTANINNATGAVSGIVTASYGSGGAVVNLSGTAQGGTGAAINTYTGAGGPGCTNASCLTTINLAAGSQALAGSSGIAIRNNAGNSVLNIASGAVISGEVRLGDGNDLATIAGVNALAGITVLDGGDDAGTGDGMIDVLTLDGVTANSNGGAIVNWEVLNVTNGSDVDLTGVTSGTVNVTDSTADLTDLTADEVNGSNSDVVIDGASMVAGDVTTCGGTLAVGGTSAVGGDVLACGVADTITITDDATIAGNIEGAGGSDTIAILGNASVGGTIFGGANGADGSAASDAGDTITINTTGTVGAVDAGLGNDTVTLANGTVGAVAMGGGNDTATWSGGTLTSFNGGLGSDTLAVSAPGYNGTQVLDGGDDAGTGDGMIDVLTLDGVAAASNGGAIVNWEVLNVTNGSDVDLTGVTSGTVNVTDSAAVLTDLTADEVNGSNSDVLIDGASMVAGDVTTCGGTLAVGGTSAVGGDVLACGVADTITITNNATIAGNIEGAGGSDTIAILGNASVGGTIFGGADGADGSAASDAGDTITINTTGTVGLVDAGLGNDTVTLANGTVGAVTMGSGNDTATWSGGTLTSFNGGLGSDTLAVSAPGYNGTQVLDGGDDASTADGMIDVLTLNGITANINGTTVLNWETLSFQNSTITATAVTANQVNVCGGSTTLTSSTIGAGGVLGCVSNDSITLNGTTTVAGPVEGAGGGDTINVLGAASVTGGVYGGGAGNDASAAVDGDDVITINTTGTVNLVDGQLGNDTLHLNGGTITGTASGGAGNDTINLAGATVTGAIDGGIGNDTFTLTAGSAGSVLGGDGDDTANWNAAAATTALVSMGNGSDTFNINSAAINLTGVVLNGGDDVSSADGWTDRLNLNAAWSGSLNGVSTTNWEEININGGTVAFSNAAVTVGVINVNGGGTLNASNNLAVTGNVAISSGSRMVVGTNTGTGNASISGNLTNGGLLDFLSMTNTPAIGDRLTVGGNYTGLPGSQIRIEAVLGASQASDQMVVRGNVTGTTTLDVRNLGGTGSLTTGDGIRLIQVDGTSASGAFSLTGGPNIDVGAFRYQLYNGGLANPSDQDWYLRSGVRDIVPPTISLARVAQDAGLTSLGTLHERVGEQEHYGKMTGIDEGYFKGMWGRALGSDYSETAKSSAFGNTRSNGQFGGLQMGIDFYRGITDGGSRIHFGGYAGHLWSGTSDFTVTPISRGPVGMTRSDGWVAGGYLTYYTPSGFYVDTVVQGDWLNHRLNAADGTSARTKSNGLLGSVEMGKSFGSKWKVEPQVQVIYSTSNVDNFADSAGVLNRIDNDNSWTGRAGFRLKRTWDNNPNSDGGLFTFYGKANIWGRLDGGTSTLTVGVSNPGAVQFKEVWGDVGVGTTFSVGKDAEFFADADVEFGIDQGATALSGRAGFRLKF